MKYVFTIYYRKSWWNEAHADESLDVVGRDLDDALTRFWVYKWKTSRDKRGSLDIVRLIRCTKVAV